MIRRTGYTNRDYTHAPSSVGRCMKRYYYCNEDTYRDNFTGAVEVELDTDKNSGDHHCNDHCACHTHDHVFPGSDT